MMQMAGNSSTAQDFKDSSSEGTGETHVFNTEDVLLPNERLERSSPVLWPDSATLCEYCQLRSSPIVSRGQPVCGDGETETAENGLATRD